MLYIGTDQLKKCYIGNTPVKQIYLGLTKLLPTDINVNVTASNASTTTVYAKINGNNVTTTSTHVVQPGSIIECWVQGYNTSYVGKVTIDGVDVYTNTSTTIKKYDYIVPDNINTITMILQRNTKKSTTYYGTITINTE